MNGWLLHKVLRWTLPAALVVAVALWLFPATGPQSDSGPSLATLAPLDDAALFDAAVARTLEERGVVRLSVSEPMPYGFSSGWHWLLYLVAKLTGCPLRAQWIIGMFCLVGVVVVWAFALRRLAPGECAFWWALPPLACSPFLHFIGQGHGAMAAASFLVALGSLFHLQGMVGERRALSPLAAGCFALAGLFQIEAAFLWLVPVLHALLVSVLKTRPRVWTRDALTDAASGTLIVLFVLWPVVDRNLRWIKIPFPSLTGVEAGGMSSGVDGMVSIWKSFVYPWAGLHPGIVVLALIGAAIMLVDVIQKRASHAWLFFPVFVIFAPLMMGAVGALSNPSGGRALLPIVTPALWIGGAAGIARIVDRIPAPWGALRAAQAVIAVLLTLGALQWTSSTRALWTEEIAYRNEVWRRFSPKLFPEENSRESTPGIASDQPGKMAWHEPGVRHFDLTARGATAALFCLNEQGQLDAPRVKQVLDSRNIKHVVLWSSRHRALGEGLLALGGRTLVGDATMPWAIELPARP